MLLALTGGQKLGILLVAAAFVTFAVLSAFVLPRRDVNFPGQHLTLFTIVAILFFAGMMTAMVTLAKESEEEGHAAEPATATEAKTNQTSPATTGNAPPKGDPAAGKQVFASAGCGGCHTLGAAGSSGNVGPNLDELKPSFEAAVKQVTNGGGGMPAFKDQLSKKQIDDVAAFVATSRR